MTMQPDLWLRVEEVFQQALDLDESRRAEFLASSCAGDDALRKEVESLLAHESRARQFMESPALEVAGRLISKEQAPRPGDDEDRTGAAFESRVLTGKRLGNYRILEHIGAGGMGEVYRAIRADDQYEKQVAIKLVRAGQDSGFVMSRFRSERQILANLDHPCIARLIDGGATEDGEPYFVMELIEGQPIDRYCDDRRLTISERLRIFLQACSAVQYAHQRLIVHRDIKPGNILVTAEGVPKLLDFGIAKILNQDENPTEGLATLTMFPALTPGYASPEQIKGEPVTTASDVYSLGIVLYELLTGHRPYPAGKLTPQEITRAVCETEPEKPSVIVAQSADADSKANRRPLTPDEIGVIRDGSPEKLRRRLEGDLDNILLMALRKEPRRRYASVEQFQEDLRRHLEHLPVIARKDTVRYLTAKFVARHKAGAAATVTVAATLLAALGITLREARIARADRARAESRFNDVRELSNTLLFQIDDSIRNVPGTTQAQELVVGSAQRYLDRLAREAGNDPSLLKELATGYIRLANIQGDMRGPNLGNQRSAIENYRKAVDLREAIARAHPADLQAQLDLQQSYDGLGYAYGDMDRGQEKVFFAKSMDIAAALTAKEPGNDVFLDALSLSYEHRAMLSIAGNDVKSAIADQREGLKLAKQVEDRKATEEYRGRLSYAHKRLGALLIVDHQLPQALAEYQSALALDKTLLSAHPSDPRLRFSISLTLSDIGYIYNEQGNRSSALENYREVLVIRQALADADPSDVRARQGLARTYERLGSILREENKPQAALTYNQREQTVLSALVAANPNNSETRIQLADLWWDLGDDYTSIAKAAAGHDEKVRLLRLAQSYLQQSLPAFEGAREKGLLTGSQLDAPQKIAEDLASCTKALHAALGNSH